MILSVTKVTDDAIAVRVVYTTNALRGWHHFSADMLSSGDSKVIRNSCVLSKYNHWRLMIDMIK